MPRPALFPLAAAILLACEAVSAAPVSVVVAREPGRFCGWPSIAQAPNGDLLVVYSGDRSGHISNDGKVRMVRSADGGKTWELPVTVFDTPIDDRDSGIVRTKAGTMVVSWFTGPYGGEWQGHWVLRSEDSGRTWGAPVRTAVTTPHGPVQLDDGRLLYLGQRPHCSHGEPKDWNGPPAESPYAVALQESKDDGRTWADLSVFPVPADAQMLSYDEPHLADAGDGRLVALFRDCNGEHFLRQSESADGGRTWSPPRVTPVCGLPPHVLRLRSGALLLSYAKRWGEMGVYACLSRDGGRTWDAARETRLSTAPDGDMGYPASVELDDGSVWTVYYQSGKAGEPPCIQGTHWRP